MIWSVHETSSSPFAQFDLILGWTTWKWLWAIWNYNEMLKQPICERIVHGWRFHARYDDVVPGMLPIFGHGSDNACSTCHLCKHPRGSKLSSSNVIRRGEVRWSHNVQFCLKSEVSLEHRGRSRSPVSCARKAADDEDLQLGYVVRNVAIEFSPNSAEQGCHIVESRHRLGLSLIGAYQNCFVQVSLACQ